jgi:hypothetical protein
MHLLLSEVIYEEELVCIVASDAPYHRQLTYLMIRHPRVNTDAAHAWLRGEIKRIGKTISS